MLQAKRAPWLAELQRDLLRVTTRAARTLWPSRDPETPAFNYRYEHVKQVERQALRLLRSQPRADADVVLAAVWLHDRFKPAFKGGNHGARAATWARDNLAALGFPKRKVSRVCDCVKKHSAPFGQLPRRPLEPLILWDADKLAHLGVVEVMLRLLNRVASDAVEDRAADPRYRKDHSTLAHIWTSDAVERFLEGREDRSGFYLPLSRKIARTLMADQTACLKALLSQMTLAPAPRRPPRR